MGYYQTLHKKCPYSECSGPYFPAFELRNLGIHPECGKMRTRKTSNTDIFHAVRYNFKHLFKQHPSNYFLLKLSYLSRLKINVSYLSRLKINVFKLCGRLPQEFHFYDLPEYAFCLVGIEFLGVAHFSCYSGLQLHFRYQLVF